MSDKRQLQLSELAPYLPYGLKVHSYYNNRIEKVIGLCQYTEGFEIDSVDATKNNPVVWKWKPSEFRPYLRPMSSLIKPINQNGKCFTPIVELLKLKYPDQPKDGKYSEIKFDSDGYPQAYYFYSANRQIKVRPHEMKQEPNWVIEKLVEWHFDIFGLLSCGLALELK